MGENIERARETGINREDKNDTEHGKIKEEKMKAKKQG